MRSKISSFISPGTVGPGPDGASRPQRFWRTSVAERDNCRAAAEQYARAMRAWALVEAGDDQAIDVFLNRDEAEDALAGCLRDEPDWRYLLRIEEIELVAGLAN